MISPILRFFVLISFALVPALPAEDDIVDSSGEKSTAHLSLAPVTTNLLQNGDFAEPVNTDRKRGKWMLLVSLKGSARFDMATSGFKTENGTLELDMAQLNPPDNSSPYAVQLSQVIAPLIPEKRYQLTFEAKASEADNQILIGLGFMVSGKMEGGLPMQTERLGTDFHPFSYDFTTANIPNTDPTKIRVDFRLGKATGVISLRNVQLIELE